MDFVIPDNTLEYDIDKDEVLRPFLTFVNYEMFSEQYLNSNQYNDPVIVSTIFSLSQIPKKIEFSSSVDDTNIKLR